MEENKIKSSQLDLLTGILFAIMAVGALRALILTFSFVNLLAAAGFLLVAAMLLIKQKDIALSVSFAVITLHNLICLFAYHGFLSKFLMFLSLAAYAFITFMSFAVNTDYLPKYKKSFTGIFFIPIILIALSNLISFLSMIRFGGWFLFRSLIYGVVEIIAVVLICKMTAFANGAPEPKSFQSNYDAGTEYAPSILPQEAFCDMVKHVLLLLFTFGIWNLIWIYKVTGYLNVVKDEEQRNPTTKLLLCMFVPFYNIYWTYKSAQRIDKLARQKGLSSDIATLCLIMAIFLPIISPIIMQDKMNSILTKNPATAYQPAEPTADTANELKKYKELLDSGVITQDDFDAKKKQLLGL